MGGEFLNQPECAMSTHHGVSAGLWLQLLPHTAAQAHWQLCYLQQKHCF